MEDIIKQVLNDIKPSKKEEKRVNALVTGIIDKINKNIKNANPVLGGSGAKGTWLKVFDADIFVKFNYGKYKDKSEQLSDILHKALKKSFPKISRLHGSRDYFQICHKGYTFEIVPILDIKNAKQAVNITDVSPLHAKWVKKHKDLADQIRLTKQFCKAQRIYGAESYIKGFSGYVCEVLTVHYGSFKKLIMNVAKWKDKTIIDINNYYKGKNILMELNKSKTFSPLILIDPVQPERNAAAALSYEKFEVFRKAAQSFVKSPSAEFFNKKDFSVDVLKLKNKDKKIIIIKASPLKGKVDIIGSKILKSYEFIINRLLFYDFTLHSHGWEWDKERPALMYFIIDKTPLSVDKERAGPLVRAKRFAEDFRKKHSKTYIKGNRIYAKVKRDIRTGEDFVKMIGNDPYIKERIKKFQAAIFN